MESHSGSGIKLLRTSKGWVSERSPEDPDSFFVERLQQDTNPFAGLGVGPERCVFVDTLRSPSAATAGSDGEDEVLVRHPKCGDIVLREHYAEFVPSWTEPVLEETAKESCADVVAGDGSAGAGDPSSEREGNDGKSKEAGGGHAVLPSAASDALKAPEGIQRTASEGSRSARSLLTSGVEVGGVDAVTLFVEIFVPVIPMVSSESESLPDDLEDACGGSGGTKYEWLWGVVVGDFRVCLSTERCPSGLEKRAHSRDGCKSVGDEQGSDHVPESNSETGKRAGGAEGNSLIPVRIVIDGPGGVHDELPLSMGDSGQWMTLKIVSNRSGESIINITPTGRVGLTEPASSLSRSSGGDNPASQSPEESHQSHERGLECSFSNPCFFRGDRVGGVGLYRSERYPSRRPMSFPFHLRSLMLVLGVDEKLHLPRSSRVVELANLLDQEHAARVREPAERPSMVFARQLRRLWHGYLPSTAEAKTERLGVEAGASVTTSTPPIATVLHAAPCLTEERSLSSPNVKSRPAQEGYNPSDTFLENAGSKLVVWEPLLPPGRVALGAAVMSSRVWASREDPTGSEKRGHAENAGDGEPFAGVKLSCGSVSTHGDPAPKGCLTAWEHPALQTPKGYKAVRLTPSLLVHEPEGQGLWAWAPVPRSERFVALGLMFTSSPQPPPLTATRCVLKELTRDAEPRKCRVRSLSPVLVLRTR